MIEIKQLRKFRKFSKIYICSLKTHFHLILYILYIYRNIWMAKVVAFVKLFVVEVEGLGLTTAAVVDSVTAVELL